VSYFLGWLAFTLATTILTMFAVTCCLYIAPAAAGSGIPDVVAYLNGVDVPAVLLFRTLVAKILGSLGSVGAGLAVGKEGPFVHIGACIASLLSQARLHLRTSFRQFSGITALVVNAVQCCNGVDVLPFFGGDSVAHSSSAGFPLWVVGTKQPVHTGTCITLQVDAPAAP
jgi:hypothetical protein